MQNVQQHHFADLELNKIRQLKPELYLVKYIEGYPLICTKNHPNEPEGLWKIALLAALLAKVIPWYHFVLGHCSMNQLYDTIRDYFKLPGLRQACEEYHCTSYQLNRQPGPGYGMLPPRIAPLIPWSDVAVDLIGPWKITIKSEEIEFNALIIIDLVSNLAEIIPIDNKTSEHVAQ
eukprot:9163373-Ditylum_brightwellii.AAC.1